MLARSAMPSGYRGGLAAPGARQITAVWHGLSLTVCSSIS